MKYYKKGINWYPENNSQVAIHGITNDVICIGIIEVANVYPGERWIDAGGKCVKIVEVSSDLQYVTYEQQEPDGDVSWVVTPALYFTCNFCYIFEEYYERTD